LKPELQARVGTVLRTRRLSLLAHAELSQILDSAGSPICVVSHERRISRFNRAFAALVDTAGREIKGALFDEALPWKPFIPELDLLGAVLAGGEVSDAQVAVEDPAGIQPQRVFLVTAAPFRGLDGELLGAILDLKDITKLKQAKADLREHRDRLQQALTELVRVQDHLVRQERLRALGQMAGSMARDFAGTLSVILGHAERLIDEREDVLDAEAAAWLRSIADTARSGAGTVEEILRFTKPRDTADPRKPLDLNEVLEEAIALTRSGWEDEARATSAPIALRRSLGRLPRVLGNEAELREALVNLISNAVDAMPGGGTLAFCTRQEDDTAIIEVSDTGVGMDEETDRRALEPFFTTKGERGTGLGLTMVYGFVKRHHGSMSLKSSPGAGTTVVLRLPLLPDVGAAPGAGVEAKVEATPSERPLHVLVVDDHPMVRDGLKAMLVADGHTVDVAEDGIAGLRAFQRGRHDLVITDKVMPTMGGERLAAFIRTTSPRTPIILVTGYADSDGKRPPSVDVVLQKPVSRDRLRQAIRALVAKSQAQP
jgi:signal transduction histidine kinase